jgi:hypothetical protein
MAKNQQMTNRLCGGCRKVRTFDVDDDNYEPWKAANGYWKNVAESTEEKHLFIRRRGTSLRSHMSINYHISHHEQTGYRLYYGEVLRDV